MYKRNAQGWSKHLDFLLIDEFALQLAFILAAAIRVHYLLYYEPLYRNLAMIFALFDAVVVVMFNTMHNVLRRGAFDELVYTIRHCAFVFALAVVYLFTLEAGYIYYRRMLLFLTVLFHVVIGYGTRLAWKWILKKYGSISGKKGAMLVVLNAETAENMVRRLLDNNLEGFQIVGVVLDRADPRTEILGIPVAAPLEEASSYIARQWVDAVYIDCAATDERIKKLMMDCTLMAIPVHYHVPDIGGEKNKRFVEKVGGTTVLTSSINYATPLQYLGKRCMDILGGLVGSVLALLIILIVGPMIKKASPGPILYKQVRIGKNGKRFKIIKIRSMYMDAEERKKDLLAQNRVKDGMMFKLDWDPRIIGNELLPDGTRKTGIGDFIRRTSLDEFPQFFNVLMGQMSLVGTRPPTVDEWEKYEYRHRARLACEPGITGLWQINGRSEITNFEEVVKLDTQYITNWSLGLDIQILLKTVYVVLWGKGAM